MQALTNNVTKLFIQYGLKNKIITYVKDEGSNINTMTIVLKTIIKCEILNSDESFQGAYFGHVFPKHANMLLLTKKFVGILGLFQSKLPSQIYKNV